MALTGQQIKLIRQALLDGFPTKDDLEMMLRIQMDVALDAVAGADNQTLCVFKLITWAERTGNVRALINAAYAEIPGNPTVKQLAAASRSWVLDAEGEPAPVPAATPQPAAQAASSADEARLKYLDHLYTRYKTLDFKGMGMSDRVALQLPLTQMYVPLKARIDLPKGETWARDLMVAGRRVTKQEAAAMGERMSEPLAVLDLLQRHAGLVILRRSGFRQDDLSEVSHRHAGVRPGRGAGAGRTAAGAACRCLPTPTRLAQQDVALQDFVSEYYRKRGIDLPVGQLIGAAMESGQALIMLDGLDEVQALAQRTLVVERVETFFDYQRKRGNKFIITSRIVGYREVRPSAEGLQECTLVDFDDDDIALVRGELDAGGRTSRQGRFHAHAIGGGGRKGGTALCPGTQSRRAPVGGQSAAADHPGVDETAGHAPAGTPHATLRPVHPDPAAPLEPGAQPGPARGARPGCAGNDARLGAVGAVDAGNQPRRRPGQERRGAASVAGDLPGTDVADPESRSAAAAERRTGLCQPAFGAGAGEYGFIHLTFQEYLAAVAIAQRGQSDLTPVVDLLAERLADARWHEVLLLTIGYMGIVQQRDEAAGDVLMRLIERSPGEPGAAVVLAGEAVLDTWPGGVTQRCRGAIEAALLQTMLASGRWQPIARARAGSILGALGDPTGPRRNGPGAGWPVHHGQRRVR